jgi:hypothetical protein
VGSASNGYVVHCREVVIGGARHETGVEFRRLLDGEAVGFGNVRYESRRCVTAPNGERFYGPWERMEAASK